MCVVRVSDEDSVSFLAAPPQSAHSVRPVAICFGCSCTNSHSLVGFAVTMRSSAGVGDRHESDFLEAIENLNATKNCWNGSAAPSIPKRLIRLR